MSKNKIIFLTALTFLIMSCETMKSIKQGVTGEKVTSTDEFLVKKKDPLVLPPDYENLPTPSERETAQEEFSKFEKKLKKNSSSENTSSSESSAEQSILRQIRKQ